MANVVGQNELEMMVVMDPRGRGHGHKHPAEVGKHELGTLVKKGKFPRDPLRHLGDGHGQKDCKAVLGWHPVEDEQEELLVVADPPEKVHLMPAVEHHPHHLYQYGLP